MIASNIPPKPSARRLWWRQTASSSASEIPIASAAERMESMTPGGEMCELAGHKHDRVRAGAADIGGHHVFARHFIDRLSQW